MVASYGPQGIFWLVLLAAVFIAPYMLLMSEVGSTFTEEGGRTTMSQLCEYGDRKVRDTVIDSGMEGGMQEALDHLEQVAVSLR